MVSLILVVVTWQFMIMDDFWRTYFDNCPVETIDDNHLKDVLKSTRRSYQWLCEDIETYPIIDEYSRRLQSKVLDCKYAINVIEIELNRRNKSFA